jgi:hypothetical protein
MQPGVENFAWCLTGIDRNGDLRRVLRVLGVDRQAVQLARNKNRAQQEDS